MVTKYGESCAQVNNVFLAGNISRKVFWDYAEFKHPTNQISFHSIRALACLTYERSEQVDG